MTQPIVFVVDDEPSVRKSLTWLLGSVNLRAEAYPNGEEFLQALSPDQPGCVVIDLRLPGVSGLAVLEQLAVREVAPPAILVTAYGNVATATRAMRAGALHVLEKPYDDQMLLDAVAEALRQDGWNRSTFERVKAVQARLAELSSREREVLELIVKGTSNKVMARRLGVSVKTIEFHRANVMLKLQVESLVELLRKVLPILEPHFLFPPELSPGCG